MNEEDLNQAFHDVLVRSRPPSSMDPARALERARRVRRQRQATWAGAAAVTLVIGAGVVPALVANYGGNRSAGDMVSGASSTAAPTTTRKTGDPWPDGQTDRTATAGPRADRAVTLLDDLVSSVPSGFTAPDMTYPDGRAMRWPQAQYASADGERDYWEYTAAIPVQKDTRVGELRVQSTTPDGKAAAAPCTLAKRFWGGTGPCTVIDIDGKKVGVVTNTGVGDYDQWATYRYDDGTVVILAQAKKTDNSARPPLTQPVYTPRQLAEQVLSPEFKISS